MQSRLEDLEVGYDIPASIGMDEAEIQTPCLVLDLNALERNITKMGRIVAEMGIRHRIHGKMHKSVDVALLQARRLYLRLIHSNRSRNVVTNFEVFKS